jgi:hypothetical protein
MILNLEAFFTLIAFLVLGIWLFYDYFIYEEAKK